MKKFLIVVIFFVLAKKVCLYGMSDFILKEQLYAAIGSKDIRTIQELLPKCSAGIIKNEFKQNLIHVALGYHYPNIKSIFLTVTDDKIQMIALFLEHGVSANEKDAFNLTPLHRACERGCYQAAALLINHNADVNTHYSFVTPLHSAARGKSIELVRLLLDNGARVNSMSSYGGTPLDYALDSGNWQIAELLLNYNGKSAQYTQNQIKNRLWILRGNKR